MKKLVFILLFAWVFQSSLILGQSPVSKLIGFEEVPVEFHSQTTSNQRGNALYCEDFSDDFDDWLVQDNGGNDIWYIGASGGPSGPLTGVVDAIDSPTADNGYALFDADLFNDPGNPQMVTGSITSPSYDLSETESVLVDFYQSYIYCCVPDSPFRLEVSVNGGSEWIVFNAHGNQPEATNEFSPNGFLTTIDISCIAAGEDNVMLKFSFNRQELPNMTHYYWMIDDICIYENPVENDLEVTQVANGDLTEFWEYYSIPTYHQDEEGLLVSTMIKNKGELSQVGAELLVEILNEDQSEVLSETSTMFDLVSNPDDLNCPTPLQDTVVVQTGWVGSSINEIYWIRSTVFLDDLSDETPENNVRLKRFQLTEDELGHADAENFNFQIRPEINESLNVFEEMRVGSYFHFMNLQDPYSVPQRVALCFGPNADPGATFEVNFYTVNEAGEKVIVASSGELLILEEWIPDGFQGQPIDILLLDLDLLTEDTPYFIELSALEQSLEVTLLGVLDEDQDNSTELFKLDANGEGQYFSNQVFTPGLSAIFVLLESTDEQNESKNTLIFPNPVGASMQVDVNEAAIQFYSIYDSSGSLVARHACSSNDTMLRVEVGNLDSGWYILQLHAADAVKTLSFIKE